MTFAAINWLDISINLLLVAFVIVCLLMTLVILMQRPKQEGLGAAFGGGVTDQVFGASTTNVLQRATVWLGSFFFVIALMLAILISHQNKETKLVTEEPPVVEEQEAQPAEEIIEEEPAEDLLPKSLIEELPEETAPEETPETAPEPDEPAEPETVTEGSSESQPTGEEADPVPAQP